jgi:hypothetical protein
MNFFCSKAFLLTKRDSISIKHIFKRKKRIGKKAVLMTLLITY